MLPVDVLETAQADLINWQGTGMSIMEMSHRGKEFESVIQKAEADLRTLLNIPANYKVLYLNALPTLPILYIEGTLLPYCTRYRETENKKNSNNP